KLDRVDTEHRHLPKEPSLNQEGSIHWLQGSQNENSAIKKSFQQDFLQHDFPTVSVMPEDGSRQLLHQ
ncbi:hypothetical protein M422DRAFT_38725, partial [Sphaerobolus stellatus SS14]